jgi:hypothetical protein
MVLDGFGDAPFQEPPIEILQYKACFKCDINCSITIYHYSNYSIEMEQLDEPVDLPVANSLPSRETANVRFNSQPLPSSHQKTPQCDTGDSSSFGYAGRAAF